MSALRYLLLALMASLIACGDPGAPIAGTTARVSPPTREESEIELAVHTTENACRGSGIPEENLALCLPFVDRASGEVRLSFQPRVGGLPYLLPLTRDNVDIFHNKRTVTHGRDGVEVEVIGHDPRRTPQLFILMIDGSGSMAQKDEEGVRRIDKVRRALISRSVVQSFFPEDVNTGVVLMSFTEGQPQPVGGVLEVIRSPEAFKQRVKKDLGISSGYTYLYEAVRYAITDLLEEEVIQSWLDDAQPTIIVLTDGFNNESPADLCQDNAPRLESLLSEIQRVRNDKNTGIRSRPSIYTVGLGKPISRKLEADPEKIRVKPQEVCGKWGGVRIDGVLENKGIDKVSLDWIAGIGGGESFIQQDTRGLGRAFQGAAAERYSWFEVKYRVGGFNLRRAFETTLRLNAFGFAESSVNIQPSGWLDAPPGIQEDGTRWASAAPYNRTALLVMPILGGLVGLAFFGAAWLNTRRAISARKPVKTRAKGAKKPKKPKKSKKK